MDIPLKLNWLLRGVYRPLTCNNQSSIDHNTSTTPVLKKSNRSVQNPVLVIQGDLSYLLQLIIKILILITSFKFRF